MLLALYRIDADLKRHNSDLNIASDLDIWM